MRVFANGAERMRITSSGNVGIGTSSPTSKLTVDGSNVTVSAGYGIAFAGDQDRIMTPEDNVSGALIRWGGTGICRFSAGATERMRIDSGGNVGIGTSSPSEKLDISGSVKSSGSFYSDGGDISLSGFSTSTIKTLSTGFNNVESYMLTAMQRGGNNAWRLSAIIFGGDLGASGSFRVVTLENTNLTASFSGASLQITNNAASTTTFRWRLLRLI
jgi:hypothetical protein